MHCARAHREQGVVVVVRHDISYSEQITYCAKRSRVRHNVVLEAKAKRKRKKQRNKKKTKRDKQMSTDPRRRDYRIEVSRPKRPLAVLRFLLLLRHSTHSPGLSPQVPHFRPSIERLRKPREQGRRGAKRN